jgi:hypothetical protein
MCYNIGAKILLFLLIFQFVSANQEITKLMSIVGLSSDSTTSLNHSGFGTGFSVSNDGYIVTASHVTESSDQVRVTLKNGSTYIAEVIKEEHGLDLAILKISAQTPDFLSVTGRTSGLGDDVYTIGYPDPEGLGFNQKFTKGSISSLTGLGANSFNYQISVPIQPGNSGGALVCEESGEVLGIIISTLVRAKGYSPQLVNYALKSGFIRPILDSLEIKTEKKRASQNEKTKRKRVINSTCLITTWNYSEPTPTINEEVVSRESPPPKETEEIEPKLTEVELLIQKAEAGDLAAQESLGHMYYFGNKVEKSFKEAFNWYKKSAIQGSYTSQYNLGSMFYNGEGTEIDYEESLKWYKLSANQGFSFAQFWVGHAYFYGSGTEKNIDEAISFWKRSARQDYVQSVFNLGLIYSGGIGVPKDIIEAISWFKQGSDLGSVQCLSALGAIYYLPQDAIKQDYRKAYDHLKKAAEKGFANAQHLLSLMYLNGDYVRPNINEYLHWNLKAALQGHPNAVCGAFGYYFEKGNQHDGIVWLLVMHDMWRKDIEFQKWIEKWVEASEFTEFKNLFDTDAPSLRSKIMEDARFEFDFGEVNKGVQKILQGIKNNKKDYFPLLSGFESESVMVSNITPTKVGFDENALFNIKLKISGSTRNAKFNVYVNGSNKSTFGAFSGSTESNLKLKRGTYDLRVELVTKSFFGGESKRSILHFTRFSPTKDETLLISY